MRERQTDRLRQRENMKLKIEKDRRKIYYTDTDRQDGQIQTDSQTRQRGADRRTESDKQADEQPTDRQSEMDLTSQGKQATQYNDHVWRVNVHRNTRALCQRLL